MCRQQSLPRRQRAVRNPMTGHPPQELVLGELHTRRVQRGVACRVGCGDQPALPTGAWLLASGVQAQGLQYQTCGGWWWWWWWWSWSWSWPQESAPISRSSPTMYTSVTRKCPSVSVLVLSVATSSRRASASSAFPPVFTTTCPFAALEMAQTVATGAASTREHGHARTRISSPLCSHAAAGCANRSGGTAITATAMPRITGVYSRAKRSTTEAVGCTCAWASVTASWIWDTVESAAVLDVRNVKYPFCRIVPP
mmetsp:Transcript_41242/g.69377  ORF Transcript_41242/g.69377 Transcript_41242/m.69377 type:complete len:254 (+) Transcript_41242:1510-2271(+)